MSSALSFGYKAAAASSASSTPVSLESTSLASSGSTDEENEMQQQQILSTRLTIELGQATLKGAFHPNEDR